MNWALPDPPRHTVHGSAPSSNGSDIYVIRPEQALKAQVNYMKTWPKGPWSPLLLPLLSPILHLWPHGEFSMAADREREDSGLLYRWFCTICRHHQKLDGCSTIGPLGTSLKDSGVGRTSDSAPGCSLCLEGEMARHVIIY